MADVLNALKATPLPLILIILGALFILVACASELNLPGISSKAADLPLGLRWFLGIFGALILLGGIGIDLGPNSATASSSIPVLKSSYTGTGDCTSGCTDHYNMILTVDSQDQQGTLRATTQYPGTGYSNYSCTGSIQKDSSITLVCQAGSDVFNFSGKLYPDGHIEGTETDGSHVYHLVLK